MKYYKKQKIGENLLYVMVWLAILLVPILNSKMMSEVHVSLSNILIAWQQIAPYLFIFIIHNAFIVRYVKRHQYMRYVVVDVLFISAVFYGVDILDSILGDFATPEHLISAKHASFTDLPVYWNIVLGLFMTCANTAIKMMYQSLRDEQAMEELKRQNLQAEMDYLKYQINPHFFMNTLNNIHSLIDIDAAYAQDAVIELSKMMRYVLYESGHEAITLEKDIQFMEELHQTDAHPLHRRRGYPVRLPERPAARRHHTAAAADRLRRKRLQARHQLFAAVVHPHPGALHRREGLLQHHQQPSYGRTLGKGRGHRPGKRPAAVAADLRQPPHARDRHPPAQHVSCQTHHPRYLP